MPLTLKPYLIIIGIVILIFSTAAIFKAIGFEKDIAGWGVAHQPLMKLIVISLLLIFCGAAVPIVLKVFIALQVRIGSGDRPLVRMLGRHGMKLVYTTWILLALGICIALPVMLRQGFFSKYD